MNVNMGYPTLDDLKENPVFFAAYNGEWLTVIHCAPNSDHCRSAEYLGCFELPILISDIDKWAPLDLPIVSAKL